MSFVCYSRVRVVIGTVLFMAISRPFRAVGNDYFTLACNFSLTTVFFFCIFLKVPSLALAYNLATQPHAGPFHPVDPHRWMC